MTDKVEVSCVCCDNTDFILWVILDEVGGRYYCSDCRDEAPDDYPLPL